MEENRDRAGNPEVGNDPAAAAIAEAIAEARDRTRSNVVNHFHFNISLNANADVSGHDIIANVLSAFAPSREAASINEASTSGTQVQASTSGTQVQGPNFSSDSDDGARGRAGGRRSDALRFVSQGRAAALDSDSSSDEDPLFAPPPSQVPATGRSSLGSVTPRPGLCAKCEKAPPTHAPSCMHLYCEPCIRKISAKKKPRKVCGRAFRSVKNLYTN